MTIERICLRCHKPIRVTKRKVSTNCQCKHCELCGSPWHYKTFCNLNSKKAIAKRNKIRQVGKTAKEWLAVRAAWFRANMPNDQGFYVCYLCGKWLDQKETTLDHVIPRSRAPHLRYEFSNLKPCCYLCNTEKGSKVL